MPSAREVRRQLCAWKFRPCAGIRKSQMQPWFECQETPPNLKPCAEPMGKKLTSFKRSSAAVLTVALISLNLMGCSTSGSQRIISRSIPGAPAYMVPVFVPAPTLGEDPYAIAARERAGRLQANRIIVKGATEWNTLAAELASP